MSKALIVYSTRTGETKDIAELIAEGLRMQGAEADVVNVTSVKKEADLEGYDAYVFGSPTYHRDMIGTMKTFLFLAQKANLGGKLGGAFGSYTHSGDAPAIIFDTMEHVFKMKMSTLGSFNLKESLVEDMEGLRACQDYGKSICEQLA